MIASQRPDHPFLRLLLIIFAMLLGGSLAAQSANDEQQAELARLISEIEVLQSSLNQYEGVRAEELRALQQLEIQIDDNHREIRQIDIDLSQGELKLANLQADFARLESAREAQEERVKEELRALHRNGNQEPIKLLLNQEDPVQFSRMLRYYDYLLDARKSRIEEYLSIMSSIQENQHAQTEQQAELVSLKDRLNAQQASLVEDMAARELLLDALELKIGDAEEQLAEKLRDRERLQELINSVQEQIANLVAPEDVQPFLNLKGEMSWPVMGSRANAFGSVRTGTMRWEGIVIRAETGTAIEAIHYGRVVFADYLRGFGMLVILDHGDDYMSLYGQNQSLLVEAGDWIRRGQPIATAGSSGGNVQSGVYFEIREDGAPVDPINWCQ